MHSFRLHILALVALVLALGAGLAHASAYGGEPHEHDGVACDAALPEDETPAVLPASPALPRPVASWSRPLHRVAPVVALPAPHARGPPARAPPL